MSNSTRIKTYREACTLMHDMYDADAKRSSHRAKVEGQLAGNLPYNPQKLAANGQAYRSNINFREMEGNVKLRVGSFIRLLFDSPAMIKVRMEDYELPLNVRHHYEEIIKEEIHSVFRNIPTFFFEFSKAMRNMVVHGPGTLFWPTEAEFVPKSAPPGKVLFSRNSSEDPDEYDVVVIKHEVKWDTLMVFFDTDSNSSAAESRGWNLKVAWKLLKKLQKTEGEEPFGSQPASPEEYEAYNTKRSTMVLGEGKPKSVEVAFIFSRESNGKVSKSMIIIDPEYEEEFGSTRDGEAGEYLYQKESEFDSFDDVLVVLLSELGNDGIHSVRGYAHRIYPHCVVGNRMLNTAIDGAVLSSTIIVQSSMSGRQSMNDVLQLGPVTMLDDTAKVVTGNISANVQPLIQMRSVLQSNTANSFGTQRPSQEGGVPGASYKTARQTEYEMVKNNALNNIEVMTFYVLADSVFKTIGRKMKSKRLSPANKKRIDKFQKRCVLRGIPEEIMKGFEYEIVSNRTIGGGSSEMHLAMTQQVLAMTPYLQTEGARNAIRDRLVALVGAENVDRYAPAYDTDKITRFSHQFARFENNDMLQGMPAIVSPDDDHSYHLQQHVVAGMETIKGYIDKQLPMSGQTMVTFLDMLLNHAAAHTGFMQGKLDSKKVEEIQRALQQIKVFHKKMLNVAQQEAAQQQAEQKRQQEIMQKAIQQLEGKDAQMQLASMQHEQEMRVLKENNNNQVRIAKAQHGMAIDEAKTQATISNMNRETAAKINSFQKGN